MKRRPDRGGSDCFALLSADELVALGQLVGIQDVDEMSHGCQCSPVRPGPCSCGVLSLHEYGECGRVTPVEEALVRLQRALGDQAEASQRRAGVLHRRLRAGGNELPIHNGALVEVVVSTLVLRGHQILGCRAGVVALVEESCSGKPDGGTTDRRNGHTSIQEGPASTASSSEVFADIECFRSSNWLSSIECAVTSHAGGLAVGSYCALAEVTWGSDEARIPPEN